MPRTFLFFESNDAEFAADIAFLNCHHAIVLNFRLQMSILRRFLPKRVNFRLTRFFDDLRKARGFDFEQFHKKKSARELRQGGSNYRCCIPALAGFVSPQSIAPDGEETFLQHRHRAMEFYHRAVKLLALLLLAASLWSCDTLPNRWDPYNRRDLYSPEPAPGSQEAMRQMRMKPQAAEPTPEPKLQFR